VLYKNGLGGLFGAGARVGGGDGQDMVSLFVYSCWQLH
jgi:hypothetical protein